MNSRSLPTREAAVASVRAVVAVALCFCVMYAIGDAAGAGSQPALLGAILTLGVSRRPENARALRAIEYPLALAAVAVVASGVGLLFRDLPLAGAVVFTCGIVLSIRLRDFGERGRRVGTLVALPLVTMLVVPAPVRARGGPLVDLAIVVAAGLIALGSVRFVGAIATRLRAPAALSETNVPSAAREANGTLSVATRMASQMAVALALAFAVGFAVFGRHWGWTVLTAFIVCSGAIGRADAAYRGFLRLTGALGGTIAATFASRLWHPSGPPEALAIFAALFFGLWLRETSYAYWAACITLVLGLLASPPSATGLSEVLILRLSAILAGALCGIAACWFVLPIRTTDVVRRRLADTLVALDAVVAGDANDRDGYAACVRTLDVRMRALERIATPVRYHRRLLTIADHVEHPGRWIEIAHDCYRSVLACDGTVLAPERRARVRRAIGTSRKAIGAHGKAGAQPYDRGVAACLAELRAALAGARPA